MRASRKTGVRKSGREEGGYEGERKRMKKGKGERAWREGGGKRGKKERELKGRE